MEKAAFCDVICRANAVVAKNIREMIAQNELKDEVLLKDKSDFSFVPHYEATGDIVRQEAHCIRTQVLRPENIPWEPKGIHWSIGQEVKQVCGRSLPVNFISVTVVLDDELPPQGRSSISPSQKARDSWKRELDEEKRLEEKKKREMAAQNKARSLSDADKKRHKEIQMQPKVPPRGLSLPTIEQDKELEHMFDD
eukprot:gnl/Hemi2/1994_TR712_c0_g1_i1.p1 gnl/Hemi2/1994_TR712_c0_g1~~gnl/Hemi2/1994_TR712_c0_g1_i1.p1  ORF type:complete len:195 (-),score=51.13 gnl/Hemi2/1994_TR712_c0_g1_i1:87-671(-)